MSKLAHDGGDLKAPTDVLDEIVALQASKETLGDVGGECLVGSKALRVCRSRRYEIIFDVRLYRSTRVSPCPLEDLADIIISPRGKCY